IRIEKSTKLDIAEQFDLAILPLPRLDDSYRPGSILLNRAEFEAIKKDIWNPGLGDEVATIGLYTSQYGQAKNVPVVRIGHIAMLPDEPVASHRGYVKAYLIETRSIAGLSGSPVFVNLPLTRMNENGKIEVRDGVGVILIGISIGYHLVRSKEDQISVP